MKQNMQRLLLLIMALPALFTSCKKDQRDINTLVTPVNAIYAPANDVSIKLKPASNANVNFEWETARAEDGTLVYYEVAFDQENGDFSKPFYKLASAGKGLQNKLSISHGDLNKIAQLGGSDFFQKKKFKWAILTVKGINSVKSKVMQTIELERPGGFASLPGNLYITGDASEGGTTIATAQKFKKTGDGTFEIFTKLKAGNFKFIDGNSGTPKEYFITESEGAKVIGINGQTPFAGGDKIVRIRLDFNTLAVAVTEVKEIAFFFSPTNSYWFVYDYAGGGVWKKDDITVNYKQEGWGVDERYKFRMITNDGTGDKNEWLHYKGNDSPGQDNQYPHTVEYRTINTTTNNSHQYDWAWKFDKVKMPWGGKADFRIYLRGTDADYTQEYIKK